MTPAEHPLDDLALYALDALDDDERFAVEAHLAGCPACVAEIDAHRAALAQLTDDEPPPPAIWQRITYEIGAGDTPFPLTTPPPPPPAPIGFGDVVAEPAAARPSHMRRGRPAWQRPAAVAAALAAAVALVVGVVAVARPDDEPTDLAGLADAALDEADAQVATLADDGGRPRARVVVDGSTGYVFVDDLPTLPAGEEYQLWKVAGEIPVSLGVLGDGSEPVAAVGMPANTTTLAISTEPAGGSPSPTGDVVASGAFA